MYVVPGVKSTKVTLPELTFVDGYLHTSAPEVIQMVIFLQFNDDELSDRVQLKVKLLFVVASSSLIIELLSTAHSGIFRRKIALSKQ